MPQAVLLLCGVPASGKTWVMERLRGKYACVANDDHIGHGKGFLASMVAEAAAGDKPVLVDCPFGEREFKAELEARGLEVYPFFIVEAPEVIAQRYAVREGKPAAQAVLTRAKSIAERAKEWAAPAGTSDEILAWLKDLVVTRAG